MGKMGRLERQRRRRTRLPHYRRKEMFPSLRILDGMGLGIYRNGAGEIMPKKEEEEGRKLSRPIPSSYQRRQPVRSACSPSLA